MRCKACNEQIVFCITKNQKWIPVDFDSLSEMDIAGLKDGTYNQDNPLPFRYGKHIAHFTTCPDADDFRDKGKTQ